MKNILIAVSTISIFLTGPAYGQHRKQPIMNEDTALTALLRRQTDLGSDAGQRGDQATVDSFLDSLVLFSGGDGSVGTLGNDPPHDSADAVSALIKQQTQAYRDAGQRGDRVAMRGILDSNVTFINEDGLVSGWSDFPDGTPAAPPKGFPSTVTLTDWVLHHYNDVAFASFIDEQFVHYGAQVLHYRFLCVETWIRRGDAWKLLESGSIPLHQEPQVVRLVPELLDEYAGDYTAGPGSLVRFSRNGDTLMVAINGGKAMAINAEARDMFFTPGFPTGFPRSRVIFQRNADGQLTGYTSRGLVYGKVGPSNPAGTAPLLKALTPGPLVLRDFIIHRSGDIAVATFFHDRETPCYGQVLRQTYRSTETWMRHGSAWKMITSQGRPIQQDPATVTLSPKVLSEYAGVYSVSPELTVTVSRKGNALAASTNGKKAVPLLAAARDVFFTPGMPRTSIIFQRDADGSITGYISRKEDRDLVFTKA